MYERNLGPAPELPMRGYDAGAAFSMPPLNLAMNPVFQSAGALHDAYAPNPAFAGGGIGIPGPMFMPLHMDPFSSGGFIMPPPPPAAFYSAAGGAPAAGPTISVTIENKVRWRARVRGVCFAHFPLLFAVEHDN